MAIPRGCKPHVFRLRRFESCSTQMKNNIEVKIKRKWLGRLLFGYWKTLSEGYSIKGDVVTFNNPPKGKIQITRIIEN